MSVAGENARALATAPARRARREERPELGVIEGRLGLATRIARFLGTILLVTFITGLVGALVLHATIIETQRDLDSRKRDMDRIAAETEELRNELAELEAPARIVAEARRIGMTDAPDVLYLQAAGSQLDDRTLIAAANQLRAGG